MLFHDKETQKKSAIKLKMQHNKRHAEFMDKLFLHQTPAGEGDLEKFFSRNLSHTNLHCNPKSPSTFVPSQICSYLSGCHYKYVISVHEEPLAPDVYDFIFIDGGLLVHSLPGTAAQGKAFDLYFDKVFCTRVRHDLKRSTRVDIVWEQYRALAIKGGTREKRGTGIRQRMFGAAKIPGNW